MNDPVQGFGPHSVNERSFNLRPWGVSMRQTHGAGVTSSGVRAKHPAMKSSTMKGVKNAWV